MNPNSARNRKPPLLSSVPDQTSSRSSRTTSITRGEEEEINFDDEWTTGNWCYVLPATPCSSGITAPTTVTTNAFPTTDAIDNATEDKYAAWEAGNWCW